MGYIEKLPKYLYVPANDSILPGRVFAYALYISPQSNQISYTHGSKVIISSGQRGSLEKLAKQLYEVMKNIGLLKYGSDEFVEDAVHYDEQSEITTAVMEEVNGVLQTLLKKASSEEEGEYLEKFYRDFWEEWDNR